MCALVVFSAAAGRGRKWKRDAPREAKRAQKGVRREGDGSTRLDLERRLGRGAHSGPRRAGPAGRLQWVAR